MIIAFIWLIKFKHKRKKPFEDIKICVFLQFCTYFESIQTERRRYQMKSRNIESKINKNVFGLKTSHCAWIHLGYCFDTVAIVLNNILSWYFKTWVGLHFLWITLDIQYFINDKG